MYELAYWAYTLTYPLLWLTAASAALAVVRRRDLHQFNILLVAVSIQVQLLVASRSGPVMVAIAIGLALLVPHCLLRLVNHFRPVSRLLLRLTLWAPVVLTVLLTALAPTTDYSFHAAQVYVGVVAAFCASVLVSEASRTAGVNARRLISAGAGTLAMALLMTLAALGPLSTPSTNRMLVATTLALDAVIFVSYLIAFTPPRRLKARWQRREQAAYLSAAAERDPEQQSQHAAKDLARATARSVGNVLTLVALRESPADDRLSIQAASHDEWLGRPLDVERGLVAWAFRTGDKVAGRVRECAPELAARLQPFGSSVLIAPVASASRTWGVVMVVQRHGSLFPEDDLVLIAQFARYAATALDHAHLAAERRERERRRADRRLREVESRMGLMLDSIKDYAMFIIDASGRVVTWHNGATHVFGYAPLEMTEEPVAPLFGMPAADFAGLLGEAQQQGHAEREGLCRRRDGGRFIGTTTIRPLLGEVAGFAVVTRDVTERRDLEDRLRHGQKMEAIGQLAGGIAHDFNNQLTAIMGYAEYLTHVLPPDIDAEQPLSQIQKAAERAAALTRQLLAFSRRQMLQPVVINLARLVGDLLPMLRRVIGEHIEITHTSSADRLLVRGDRSQLEQIVVNLAVNARDAMPIGGTLAIQTATVWLDEAAAAGEVTPGSYVLLEVNDTGIGMDEATQSRIFEPFFTTKEFGRGTGLGLATAYGIVQQMGGVVRVTSARGEGATFRLYFPETAGQEVTAATVTPAPLAPSGTETVLLVEDEEAVRTYLTETLERHGYRVIAADQRAAALARAQAYADPIDLVIADVVMPGGTGPDLALALEAIKPGVPTLYISGYADVVLAQRGVFPKACHFLQKPFSAQDLLVRVNEILSRE